MRLKLVNPGRWRYWLPTLVAVALAAGCGRGEKRFQPAWLAGDSDVRSATLAMLENPDANVRLAAVEHLASTSRANSEPVTRAFALVARTDTNESVRRASLHALIATDPRRLVGTSLPLLGGQTPKQPANPAGDRLRYEAVFALLRATQKGRLSGADQRAVHDVLLVVASKDASRDVRILAVQLLGYHPSRAVVETLIKLLRDADFGIVYEAERSLMRVTGRSYDHDPKRWARWLANADDPFADRGKLDHVLDPLESPSWWRLWKK